MMWGRGPQTSHLFPFPLTMQLDETSPRLADWTLQNLEFCGQVGCWTWRLLTCLPQPWPGQQTAVAAVATCAQPGSRETSSLSS